MKLSLYGVKRLTLDIGPEVPAYDVDIETVATALSCSLTDEGVNRLMEAITRRRNTIRTFGLVDRAVANKLIIEATIFPNGEIEVVETNADPIEDIDDDADLDEEFVAELGGEESGETETDE